MPLCNGDISKMKLPFQRCSQDCLCGSVRHLGGWKKCIIVAEDEYLLTVNVWPYRRHTSKGHKTFPPLPPTSFFPSQANPRSSPRPSPSTPLRPHYDRADSDIYMQVCPTHITFAPRAFTWKRSLPPSPSPPHSPVHQPQRPCSKLPAVRGWPKVHVVSHPSI